MAPKKSSKVILLNLKFATACDNNRGKGNTFLLQKNFLKNITPFSFTKVRPSPLNGEFQINYPRIKRIWVAPFRKRYAKLQAPHSTRLFSPRPIIVYEGHLNFQTPWFAKLLTLRILWDED